MNIDDLVLRMAELIQENRKLKIENERLEQDKWERNAKNMYCYKTDIDWINL